MKSSSRIVVVKCNGFLDVLYSDIEISDEFVDLSNVIETMDNHDNGLFEISKIKIYHDKGQWGEYGWEIKPHCYIDDCDITKICDVSNYLTNSEREYIESQEEEKRVKELQDYVSSFSNSKVKYSLCKLWGVDKLALRKSESRGMFRIIHEFEDDSTSVENLHKIKSWITKYFNSKNHE